MENVYNQELLICDCESVEHQIVIRSFKDDYEEQPEVFLEIHLAKLPLLKRLVYAIKYVFGYQSKYGAFSEFILNKNHIEPLNNVINHLEKVENSEINVDNLLDEKYIDIEDELSRIFTEHLEAASKLSKVKPEEINVDDVEDIM